MEASAGLLLDLGVSNVERHLRSLGDRIVNWAKAHSKVRLVTPADPNHRSGIIAFTLPDIDAACARLRSAGIYHSVREGAIRLSPFIHTTEADLEKTLRIVG
jgi:cysteine desulfurase / selenocysteine lyase